MAKLEGEFEVTSWDEDTYQKLEGERKAHQGQCHSGTPPVIWPERDPSNG